MEVQYDLNEKIGLNQQLIIQPQCCPQQLLQEQEIHHTIGLHTIQVLVKNNTSNWPNVSLLGVLTRAYSSPIVLVTLIWRSLQRRTR
jgi:hypothetical protein